MPDRHCRMDDGEPIRPLDIVSVPLVGDDRGAPGQPENRRVRSGVSWRRRGRLDASVKGLADGLVDASADLWGSAESGRADRVPQSRSVDRSLMLLQPQNFEVVVSFEPRYHAAGTQRKVRARFDHGGRTHLVSLTDDEFTDRIVPAGPARNQVIRPSFGDRCLLCVSLGVPFHGYRYKLVAGVIPIVPFPGGA